MAGKALLLVRGPGKLFGVVCAHGLTHTAVASKTPISTRCARGVLRAGGNSEGWRFDMVV